MTDRKFILSIEDDVDIAHLIQLVLRSAPATVEIVSRPDEALELLRQRQPDLILLDLMLPQMPGLDLLELMQQQGVLGATPVLVVSVRTETSQRQRAKELGVAGYITKPFSPMELRAEIERALGVDWKEYW